LTLPGWVLVVVAALAMVVGLLALIRGSTQDVTRQMVQMAVVLVMAVAAGWALDRVFGRDRAAERVEALALELTARAFAPGSPLACLDAIAGEAVEDACEKALFASAETTAAAVSYVAAQLALLAAGGGGGWDTQESRGFLRNSLRRAVETDRFGIVAHVLAVRGGCTPNHCGAFALLQDSTRVKTNLVRRPFEARVAKHMAAWSAPGNPAAAPLPEPTELSRGSGATNRAANRDLYFPSAESIPPVNIMTSEPAQRQPNDTAAEAPAGTSPRKPTPPPAPPPAAPPVRQPPAPARSEPLQLVPSAQ
jgi:hypothetical protein